LRETERERQREKRNHGPGTRRFYFEAQDLNVASIRPDQENLSDPAAALDWFAEAICCFL